MSPAIRIEQVSKRFGSVHALDAVDLEVQPGEFFGLLGPNGAGKTTLISALAGLVRPDAGRLRVMNHDVQADYRAARRQLGVVPQELVFDPFFSVRESLKIQSGYFGIADNDAWIDEILENLGLTSKANANMRMLSGGMKRRVLVAQALVHRPPVIVLDEPTAAPDTLGLHPAVEPGRTYDRVDHALSRRSRDALQSNRDAEGWPDRRAGYDTKPVAAFFHAQPASARRGQHSDRNLEGSCGKRWLVVAALRCFRRS